MAYFMTYILHIYNMLSTVSAIQFHHFFILYQDEFLKKHSLKLGALVGIILS